MTKSKRSRPVPTDYEQSIADIVKQSKKRAVESLDSYLQICNVVEDDRRDLIKVIETALSCQKERASQDQLPTSPESSPASPLHTATTRARTKSTATSSDEHDEVCDVCEKGGDLLCCDTCTLVFHLSCLRPPLAVIPKGKWSCPHCVVDGLGSGDKEAARRSVAAMSRTSHETLLRRQFPGNFNISKSNKRFVVRRLVNGRTSEVGRFESLEEALSSLPEIQQQKKKDNADAAREKYSDVSDEAEEDDDDEDGLWCTHCMDDHDILNCAFCGCQACFGKQQSEYLLMCDGDGCDAEYHTFCLNPQLTEIPVSSWYCEGCHANHRQNPADLKKHEKYAVQPKLSSKLPLRDPVGKFARKTEGTGRVGRPRTISSESVQSVQSTGSRGRGRPPGSGKQRLESAERAAVVAAEAMQHQGAGGYSVAPAPAGIVGFSRQSEASSIYSTVPSIGTVSDASPRLGSSHHSEFSMKGKPGFKSVQMQQSNPRIEIPPLIASPRATVLPMSMENAKKVIERICVEPWEPVDRQLLDQFRAWASVPDLETLLEFMVSQKDALASSIKQKDPTFSLEELQKEVETEFEADKLSAAAAAAIRASIETPPSTTASESRKTKADTTKGAISRTGTSSSRTTGKVSPGGTAAPKPPRMRGSPKDGKKRKTISSAAAASMSAVTSAMPSPYALLPLQGLTAVPSSVHLQLHGSNNANATASSIYSCVPLPPTYAVALPNSTGQFAPLNMRNYGSVPSTLPLTPGIASNMESSTLNSMMAGTHPVPTYVMQQPQGYTVNPTTSPYQHPGMMSHVSGPNAR